MIRFLLLISLIMSSYRPTDGDTKINGLCLVAPPYEVKGEYYDPMLNVNANWVAIIPYAFCNQQRPKVTFDHPSQWVGEKTKGIEKAVMLAKEKGLKVLLKPHLWVPGQGWAGDLDFENKTALEVWMNSYEAYILHYSQLAETHQVEMLSIGTEIRILAKKYPKYWSGLISKIRKVYQGKLTYSANWDNYKHITFWSDLDYIGIDAYFPTSESSTPSVDELIEKNSLIAVELEVLSNTYLKKVLFTEYGFRSRDYCAAGHWATKEGESNINQHAQANAYLALLDTYWPKTWFGGGFAWKWFYKHSDAGGATNTAFTPQNKLAEEILKKQYRKNRSQLVD